MKASAMVIHCGGFFAGAGGRSRGSLCAHDGTVNATSTLGNGTQIQLSTSVNGVNAERKADMEPQVVVMLGAFVTATIFAIGIPLAKAYSRKIDAEAKNPRIPSEVASRLERMEQAIEAVAIEVERISEGQRFTTKLLSEGQRGPDALQTVQAKDTK